MGVVKGGGDKKVSGVQVFDEAINVKVVRGEAALLDGALESGVVAVLDRVIGASGQDLSDGAPLVPQGGVQTKDGAVLIGGPILLLEGRVELVHPSLAGLLAAATRKVGSDGAPVLGAVAGDEVDEQAVLLDAPRAARGLWTVAEDVRVQGRGRGGGVGARVRVRVLVGEGGRGEIVGEGVGGLREREGWAGEGGGGWRGTVVGRGGYWGWGRTGGGFRAVLTQEVLDGDGGAAMA